MKNFGKKIVVLALGYSSHLIGALWVPSGSGTWNTPANWDPATVPNAAGESAIFSTSLTSAATIDLTGSPFTIGTLKIETDQNVNIGAGMLTMDTNGNSGNLIFSSTGTYTIGANITLNVPLAITQGSSNAVTVTGTMSGANEIVKEGSGKITLGTVTITDGTSAIKAGIIELSGTGTFTKGITVNEGGELSIASGDLTTSSPVAVNEGTLTVSGVKNVGTLSGTGGIVNLNGGSLTVNQASDATVSAVVTGTGGLIKEGGSGLTLAGDNNYTGTTTVNAGTLVLSNNNSIGLSAALVLNPGATLQLAGSVVYSAGVTTLGAGTATIDTNGSDLTLSNQVTGTGPLVKTGSGKLILGGTNTNNYSGGTTVSAGSLEVVDNNALGTGAVTLQAATTLFSGGSVDLSNNVTIGGLSSINVTASTLTLSGVIIGTGGFSKNGAGTLSLSGNNGGFSGGILLNEGIVEINNANSLGGVASTLTLQGGELRAAAAVIVANGIVLSSGGTINTNGNSLTLSGVISGSGTLMKTGLGILSLDAANTYSGSTVVNGGELQLANAMSLGNSSQLALSGANLFLAAVDVGFSGETTVTGTSTINTTGNTLTLGSGLSGASSTLTKSGAGILNLGGSSTLGVLNANAGMVNFTGVNRSQSIETLNGTGMLNFMTNTLTINQGNFTGSFSGMGELIKNGASVSLTLSDASGFSGDLTVNAGTLNFTGTLGTIGNLSGASGEVNFSTGMPVTITQTESKTFAGNLSGSDTITKTSGGTLALTGASDFTGVFNVDGGILSVDGNINQVSNLVVNNNGTLTGMGSARQVTVNGTFIPGEPLGTFTVINDYMQNAGGVLNININTLSSNRLLVNGIATLTGSTLNVTAQGSCFEGQTYDIVIAQGGIVGDWAPLSNLSDCKFRVDMVDENGVDIARLTSLNTVLFIGQQVDAGNPSAVKNYLNCIGVTSDSDLVVALATASALNDAELNAVLNQLHPGIFGAFTLTSLDTHTLVTKTLAEQIFCQKPCPRETKEKKEKVRQQGWVELFGSFTTIDQYQQLRDYDTRVGGVLAGYDVCLPLCGIFGWTLGYQHTDLEWDQSAGKASINGFFSGLYLGYSSRYIKLDVEVIGGKNFYDVRRNIRFTGFNDQAKNNHNGYFFTPRLGLAFDFYPGKEGMMRLFGAVNYDYLFQESYTEGQAAGLDLLVEKKVSRVLRTEVGIRFAADMELDQGCLYLFGSPSWVRKIPLDNGRYRSKFKNFIDSPCLLVVDTFDQKKDLVAVDLGFFYTFHQMVASLVYRGEFGHDYLVNQVEGKWQWFF